MKTTMLFRCAILLIPLLYCGDVCAHDPIPDKLVVLTFDDSAKTHFTIVRPILKEYGVPANKNSWPI